MTEHLHEKDRWCNCARLFLTDAGKTSPSDLIHVPGMKTPLVPFQAFGVFVMLEMEKFLNGGYNADDMGMGKVEYWSPYRDRNLLIHPRRSRYSASLVSIES